MDDKLRYPFEEAARELREAIDCGRFRRKEGESDKEFFEYLSSHREVRELIVATFIKACRRINVNIDKKFESWIHNRGVLAVILMALENNG